jgi:hypothetical protein
VTVDLNEKPQYAELTEFINFLETLDAEYPHQLQLFRELLPKEKLKYTTPRKIGL